MAKKKFTKEQERAYWQGKRDAYIAMSRRMLDEPGWEWRDPLAFYRDIFPEGFLQERWAEGERRSEFDGKPNAIALKFGPKTRKQLVKGKKVDVPVIERLTVTDDLEGVSALVKASIAENAHVYMAPVSWYGRNNRAANARFLHAFAVDLDGVTPAKLGSVLKQMRNGHDPANEKWVSMPQASYIVMSGRGLHLYYLLDRPVPLVPAVVPFLQQLKRRLTDVVWTDYTSEDGNEGRQYQGIYQGFRMPGTTTRLNGYGVDAKDANKYEALAFMYAPEGASEPRRVTLEYLVDYCGIRGKEIPGELYRILETKGGRTPIAEAKERWPEWHERRVVQGEEKEGYDTNRGAYESWLSRIEDEAVVHGRYFAVLALVAYAVKCNVPLEDLERDAYALVPALDKLSDDPGNRFTDYDVACALSAYGSNDLRFWKNEYMCRRAKIAPHANKHNGRPQALHLEGARAIQEINDKANGTCWRDGNGRKPKRDEIRAYAAEHPEASQRAIAKALGVSPTTVNKWLKPDRVTQPGGKAEGSMSIEEAVEKAVDEHLSLLLRKHGEVLIADREDYESQQSLADLLEEAGDWAFDKYWDRLAEKNGRSVCRVSIQSIVDDFARSQQPNTND
jgi:predicted transcriptional regulator